MDSQTMTDDMNKRRDELADKRSKRQCTTGNQDLDKAIAWYLKIGFEDGFDAGVAEMQAQNDALKAQLEIAVKACQLYEQAFDDTGNDYSHLVCLEEAQKLLEQIQKMLRKNEGDEQW